MRVIVAHNFYRSDSPSGENAVVEYETRALRDRGVEVLPLFRHSDDIVAGKIPRGRLALSPVRNSDAMAELDRLVRDAKPDILHVHNLFPLLSPALISRAHRLGLATVATVHNHRYYCMVSTLRRDGHACTQCLRLRTPLPGLLHRCYRESRLQSASMAIALTRHASTFRAIDRYIALSADIRDTLVRFGAPAERITVKPNTVEDPGAASPTGSGFLYVGRLTEEKGIEVMLRAWAAEADGSRGTLTIAGDGPLRSRVEAAAAEREDIGYLGSLAPTMVPEAIRDAAVVVVPSLWSEAFPRVVVEALAHGRPLLTTTLGSLPDMVGPAGWVVEPSVPALDAAYTAISTSPEEQRRRGVLARERFVAHFGPDTVMDQLLDAYRKAREVAR